MYAVIFEVWPYAERREDYLAIAAELRAELELADGFISIERFESLTEEGKLLSLSFWRDEAAVAAWRNNSEHKKAQFLARKELFRDYRLRIAGIERDYTMFERTEAPQKMPEVKRAR
jgi:heme-degrading monooxygenase HmoA